MKVFKDDRNRSREAFTIVEFVIAGALVAMMVVTFAAFIQMTGVTIANVTNQATFNQSAGHASELIIRRLRLANTATNGPGGDTLTLSFDDDPEVDSSGDGVRWNDLDRFEQFAFVTTDGDATTLEDNTLTHNENVGVATTRTLIESGVRRLTGLEIFVVTNDATVLVNFGVLATNETANSQGIEVRTQTRLRNSIE